MDDRIKVIREALDRALTLIGEMMSYDNYEAYPPNLTERVNEFIAPFNENEIAALDSLAVEPHKDVLGFTVEVCCAATERTIGAAAALITADRERIKAKTLAGIRAEIAEWRDELTCGDYDDGYLDGTNNAIKIVDDAIMGTKINEASHG